MKKILFILDNLEGGGAERVFMNIANGFVENNIEVEFLLGIKSGVYLQSLHPGIEVNEVGSTNFFAYFKAFPRIFKQNNYTHIFTASHYPAAAAILTKKRLGLPAKIFQTHHYTYPEKRERKHWKGDMLLKTLFYFTAPHADKIIAVSKGSLEWLRKFSRRKLPQGIHIYNPVFDKSIYTQAKETINFPTNIDGKTILVTVGRLSEEKDQLTMINAFAIYRKKNPSALLFILGTGPLEQPLQQYIREKDLQNNIYLTGFQTNPYKWIACCDAFLLSSKFEGFGNVIAEAMALGKTVVSSDCPSGPGEILEKGRLGYLCPVQNPAEMAIAIEKAVQQPIDKDLLTRASIQYSNPVIIQKYLAEL